MNCRRRRLIWPKDRPREAPPEVISVEVNNQPAELLNVRANTTHQKDMKRRIKIMDKEITREEDNRLYQIPTSHYYPIVADLPKWRVL